MLSSTSAQTFCHSEDNSFKNSFMNSNPFRGSHTLGSVLPYNILPGSPLSVASVIHSIPKSRLSSSISLLGNSSEMEYFRHGRLWHLYGPGGRRLCTRLCQALWSLYTLFPSAYSYSCGMEHGSTTHSMLAFESIISSSGQHGKGITVSNSLNSNLIPPFSPRLTSKPDSVPARV